MLRTWPRRSFIALIFAAGLVMAACGGDVGEPSTDPTVASVCEPGTVDCDDTAIPSDTGSTAAHTDDELVTPGDPISSGVPANGGLSIAEALETDATGVLAVRGFIIADVERIQLCDLLLESFPPQCGGASIELGSLDAVDTAFEEARGVTWTDDMVVVFGEIIDGVLAPDPLVTG